MPNDLLCWHEFSLISARMNNYINYNVYGQVTYRFSNVNVEPLEFEIQE